MVSNLRFEGKLGDGDMVRKNELVSGKEDAVVWLVLNIVLTKLCKMDFPVRS
jgi:hypothetical protein